MAVKNTDTNSLVEKQQIEKAVAALRTYIKKTSESSKNILDSVNSQDIHLQFSYKLVPKLQRQRIHVVLNHSSVEPTTSICLFVKDLVKSREYVKTIHQYKEILAARGVKQDIEIFPMKKLKLEYSDYEAKKNLSNAYDLFLCDARVTRLLPALLGKHFIGRKRFPLQVRLDAKDLKKEFNTALSTSTCDMSGRGSSCQMTVGNLKQSDLELVDNIMTSMIALGDGIPGGSDNIRNFVIKTSTSKALPLYLSLGSKADVVLPRVGRTREEPEVEEVTTVLGAKVSVNSRGVIKIIHEKTGVVEEIEVNKASEEADDGAVLKTKGKRERVNGASTEKGALKKVKVAPKSAREDKVKSASTGEVQSALKKTVKSATKNVIKSAPTEKVKSASKNKVKVDKSTKSTKRRKLA